MLIDGSDALLTVRGIFRVLAEGPGMTAAAHVGPGSYSIRGTEVFGRDGGHATWTMDGASVAVGTDIDACEATIRMSNSVVDARNSVVTVFDIEWMIERTRFLCESGIHASGTSLTLIDSTMTAFDVEMDAESAFSMTRSSLVAGDIEIGADFEMADSTLVATRNTMRLANGIVTGASVVKAEYVEAGDLVLADGARLEADFVNAASVSLSGAVLGTSILHSTRTDAWTGSVIAGGSEPWLWARGAIEAHPGSMIDAASGLVLDGTLMLAGGASVRASYVSVEAEGLLEGAGDIRAGGLYNSATLAPEGLALTGSYSQRREGEIAVELSRPGVLFSVLGDAEIAGRLAGALGAGYEPAVGDEFIILSASSLVGQFDHVALPSLEPALDWRLDYTGHSVVLAVACRADFSKDGMLDVFDFLAFLTAFGHGDPAADLAEPFGVYNLFDVLAFQRLFGEGCP